MINTILVYTGLYFGLGFITISFCVLSSRYINDPPPIETGDEFIGCLIFWPLIFGVTFMLVLEKIANGLINLADGKILNAYVKLLRGKK